MPDRSKTRDPRPRDPNVRAFQIVLEGTGQAPKFNPLAKKLADPAKNPAAVEMGRLGGLKVGLARAAKLSPKKRSEIAAKAAKAPWGKSGSR